MTNYFKSPLERYKRDLINEKAMFKLFFVLEVLCLPIQLYL